MRRRDLILGLLTLSAMGTAHAQQSGKAKRIAIVYPAFLGARGETLTPQVSGKRLREFAETSGDLFLLAFLRELDRLGYVEGQSLLIEGHSGEGQASHYPDLARDVVSRNPDVIITVTTNLTLDFKATTTTIPIVGAFGGPVEAGIVASLARPGGNITGATVDVGQEQWAKRIQLLQQVVPQATRFGFLESRATREKWGAFDREVERRTGITRVGPPFDHPTDEAEYRRVFAALAQNRTEAVLVSDETENLRNLKLIVELAEKSRLPAIYPFKMFIEAGGLMSYGIDVSAVGHSVADIVSQILKGAKPGEIPIFQPTKFELAINLRTAKALGLTVPPELLTVADEVIDQR